MGKAKKIPHLRDTKYSRLHTTSIDVTLIQNPNNPKHIFRMPANPKVDAAWDRIAHWGYGPDTYMAEIDAFHQLHCLDILRQNIMCHADMEMLTYNWRLTQHNPFPDMGAVKMCRDFDALLKWQEEDELKDKPAKWAKMVRPVDAVMLPMPERFNEAEVTGYLLGGVMLTRLEGVTMPNDCYKEL
ncbi:hypothetical protein B0T14DRAFT_490684 [Immersiella caudata]|uniref:Uncharacterized protein n=1 Tax=Immersiella caudata TaxID=314043 RepID=A0AA39XE49_9PEZI|nr:hypothetical protein B0T14DRAFT_490684 [Immersiella caudata]